jgi:predicted RecA/RadA family phage recombinase
MYYTSGSAFPWKGAAKGTGSASAKFLGVLVDTTVKGSYGAVLAEGVVQLPKATTTSKIEVGELIYGGETTNNVGTLVGGTALGVCFKQSATTDSYVSVKLLPFYITGAGGFHA